MKQILLICVLLCIIYAQVQYPADVQDANFRRDQFCGKGPDGNQLPGAFWDLQKCELCAPNCYCSSFMGCDSCPDGFILYTPSTAYTSVYSQITKMCVPCDLQNTVKTCCITAELTDPVGNISFAIQASSCFPGYRLFGGYCLKIQNCQNISDAGICTLCNDGYYLDQNHQCQSCSGTLGCSKCSGPYTCTECIKGYYIYQDSQKPHGVKKDDIKIVQNTICQKCDDNCICSGVLSSDATPVPLKCNLGCQAGFFWKNSNSCVSCGNNCVVCAKENECSVCESYYALNKVAPIQCYSFVTKNCFKADVVVTGGTPVAVCQKDQCKNQFYYSDSTSTCEPCDKGQNFERCSSNKVATQCLRGSGSNWINNPINIKYPDVNTLEIQFNNINQVNGHYKEYYLVTVGQNTLCVQNNNSCRYMKKNAVSDTDAQICDSCYDQNGLYIKGADNTCQVCNDSVIGCQLCKLDVSAIVCDPTGCKSGYYYNTSKKCTPCNTWDQNCATCSSTECTLCNSGYRIDGTPKSCKVCTVKNCAKCTADGSCAQCNVGFFYYTSGATNYCMDCGFYDGATQACEVCNLDNASAPTKKVCTKCAYNYKLNNGSCYNVNSFANCVTTTDSTGSTGNCTSCKYGYRLLDGYCYPIDAGSLFASPTGFINSPQGCIKGNSYAKDSVFLFKNPLTMDSVNALSLTNMITLILMAILIILV